MGIVWTNAKVAWKIALCAFKMHVFECKHTGKLFIFNISLYDNTYALEMGADPNHSLGQNLLVWGSQDCTSPKQLLSFLSAWVQVFRELHTLTPFPGGVGHRLQHASVTQKWVKCITNVHLFHFQVTQVHRGDAWCHWDIAQRALHLLYFGRVLEAVPNTI